MLKRLATLALALSFAAPSQAKAPLVRFAYQDRVADAASIVAVRKAMWDGLGVRVVGKIFTAGPETLEALVSGSADIATMGDTTAIIAVSRAPVVIIASHGNGERRHRIIVRRDSPIRQPSQLIGKKIAVKKGTSTYGGLLAWLKKYGLLGKVRIIDMRPPDMPDALVSGAVDAIVASEPTPSVIEAKGLGRQLATLAGLGSNYPILLVARRKFVQQHRDAVRRFLQGMNKACYFVRNHRRDAARIIAPVTGLSPQIALRSMSLHQYWLNLNDHTIRSLRWAANFLVSQRIIPRVPDFDRVIVRGLF